VCTALVRMCGAWWYDLRLERACVGDGDGYGEGFASEVGRLRRCDHDVESGVVKVVFGHRTSGEKGYYTLEEIHRGGHGCDGNWVVDEMTEATNAHTRRHRLQCHSFTPRPSRSTTAK